MAGPGDHERAAAYRSPVNLMAKRSFEKRPLEPVNMAPFILIRRSSKGFVQAVLIPLVVVAAIR